MTRIPATRLHLPVSPPLVRAIIALAAVLVTVWAQWLAPPNSSFFASEWLRDRYIELHTVSTPEDRVLVVDIDEASIAKLGPWPWPRARIAELVEILLSHYEAKGVALDIVFPEPAERGGDARLALLAENGPVVVPHAFEYDDNRPLPLRIGVAARGSTLRKEPGAIPASGYIANHGGMAQARHVGNIGFLPESNGSLRRLPLLTEFNGAIYPTLALSLIDCCSGAPRLAIDSGAFMRVHFKRDWSAYTVVSAAEILNEEIEVNSIRQRLVVLGSSSLSLADRVSTPLAANRPGLWVHAAMLSTLLDKQSGMAAAPWPGRLMAVAFAILVAAMTTWALPRLSALSSALLLTLATATWLGAAAIISQHDPDFSTTSPLASILVLLALAVPYQWQLAQQRSRSLLGTLRQYVAPEVVDELLRSDLKDPLLPSQCDVTTLIADMEGYTTQVESLPVLDAATLTRDFLDCLTGPVIAMHGTLDKYTGDGLVAFWGAPLPIAEHADDALAAASEIVRRVAALSAQRELAGHPRLRVRIGIESGVAMAGDFGTSFRSIYTAVGDSVNTAARLEQAARDFPHDIIVGAGTVERARRHRFIALGERRLRGKEKTVALFTIDPASPVAAVPSTQSRQAGPTERVA